MLLSRKTMQADVPATGQEQNIEDNTVSKTNAQHLAESEIKDIQIRFCRANDRRDEELMRSCFYEDAIIELHQPLDINSFIALGRQVLDQYTVTWHNTGNQLVEVEGSVAWAEHYTTSSHRIAADQDGPERDFVASGRYIDRLEQRDGVWRILRRKMVIDFTRTDVVAGSQDGIGVSSGTRDRNDPSYGMRLNA